MDRRVYILASGLAALLAASGCQDYNFNPVGHCLIQPGTRRVTLSSVSTADILFVVDDSGSMGGEQLSLSQNFTVFLTKLQDANFQRVTDGLEPLDFHIAITSTALYRNPRVTGGSTCSSSCPGATGSLVCCQADGAPQPVSCKVTGDCASGYTCRGNCDTDWPVTKPACFDSTCRPQRIACDFAGRECGNLEKYYQPFTGCSGDPGYAAGLFGPDSEFPMGRFMADPATGNDLVLHFDKRLYKPAVLQTEIDALALQFQQNIEVGTCGSGQETGLEAAKLALDRAREVGGLSQTDGYVEGEFLHRNSKLVVVWVTDEDDCSAPANGADAVVYRFTQPGIEPDVCELDAYESPESLACDGKPAGCGEHRQTSVETFADYFMPPGRPFGAAFIASVTNNCDDANCTAAMCCGANGDPAACGVGICSDNLTCGALNESTRYMAFAEALRQRGADVVVGSVCDAFGTSLSRIAEIVKPPTGLTLPTKPAAAEVTILRIVRKDGTTRKTCGAPAPEAKDAATAAAEGYDWWFTENLNQTTDAERDPWAPSENIYINHATGDCKANAGETYSADYLGLVPTGGCWTDQGCADALGGVVEQWNCFGEVAPIPPDDPGRAGTCLCN